MTSENITVINQPKPKIEIQHPQPKASDFQTKPKDIVPAWIRRMVLHKNIRNS